MRKSMVVAVLIAAFLPALPTELLACGESIFRVGKGVHYRPYSAPVPGAILVYAGTDKERAVAEMLRQAGHDVRVVSDDAGLELELRTRRFDVVVSDFSNRAAVKKQTEQNESRADFIPVVEKGSPDLQLARSEYDRVVTSNADVRKYLKAIHDSLKVHDSRQ